MYPSDENINTQTPNISYEQVIIECPFEFTVSSKASHLLFRPFTKYIQNKKFTGTKICSKYQTHTSRESNIKENNELMETLESITKTAQQENQIPKMSSSI